MKIKSITFITLLLALIFVCSPIVAVAANNADSLGVSVVNEQDSSVKYSDLFYVCDTAYLLDGYFTEHS